MEEIYSKVAGIDVHKKVVVCAILKVSKKGKEETYTRKIREFKTFNSDLQKMAQWLSNEGVEVAAMESTSVYWMPVYEACEKLNVHSIVVNAYHVKNVPGRKTDVKDSEWLAKLVMSGLLKKSFIPCKDLREIRVVSRYRKKVIQNLAAEKTRLGKYLDASGIRISNVVSRIDGVSALNIIDRLLEKGSLTLDDLSLCVKGSLKEKKEELMLALEGQLSDRHKIVLKGIRDHIKYLEKQRDELGEVIVEAMVPYKKEWEVIQTIPGFDEHSAAALLAEIGNDMSHFQNSKHLSSWAGVAPGNNESAGKKKHRR